MIKLIKKYLSRRKLIYQAPTQLPMKGLQAFNALSEEVYRSPFPKVGETWALNGKSFLIQQADFPFLGLYLHEKDDIWYGHIDAAGAIYKIKETWIVEQVHKQTKTLEEFIQLRQYTPG